MKDERDPRWRMGDNLTVLGLTLGTLRRRLEAGKSPGSMVALVESCVSATKDLSRLERVMPSAWSPRYSPPTVTLEGTELDPDSVSVAARHAGGFDTFVVVEDPALELLEWQQFVWSIYRQGWEDCAGVEVSDG